MASVAAIHAVGESLSSYLQHAFQTEKPFGGATCNFPLMASHEMALDPGKPNAANPEMSISLYLYRVTVNKHLRNRPDPGRPPDVPRPLALDLHYLLTVRGK